MELMQSDSIKDKFKLLTQMGGAMTQIIYRDNEGRPIAAAIFVQGEESEEVIDAIKTIEDSWQ